MHIPDYGCVITLGLGQGQYPAIATRLPTALPAGVPVPLVDVLVRPVGVPVPLVDVLVRLVDVLPQPVRRSRATNFHLYPPAQPIDRSSEPFPWSHGSEPMLPGKM